MFNYYMLIKPRFSACLSTYTHGSRVLLIRNQADQLSVELLIAANGQAQEDHLFSVDHAVFNFIVSCIAELIFRELYPFHPAPTLYTHTHPSDAYRDLQSFYFICSDHSLIKDCLCHFGK